MTKDGIGWLIKLLYELATTLFRCREHIKQRYLQYIAA